MAKNQTRAENDRITSMIILICMTVIAVGCVLGISYLIEYNFYAKGDNGETAKNVAVQLYSADDIEEVKNYYDGLQNGLDDHTLEYYRSQFSPQTTNFVYLLCTSNGTLIETNCEDRDSVFENYHNAKYRGSTNYFVEDAFGGIEGLKINYYIETGDDQQAKDKYYHAFVWIDVAFSLRYVLFAALLIAIVVILIILSIITMTSGNKENKDGEIELSFIDRLPLDVIVLFVFVVFFSIWIIVGLTVAGNANMVLKNMVILFSCIAFVLVLMSSLSTLSVRIKTGSIFKNTLAFRLFYKFKRKTPRKIRKKLFSNISTFKKLIFGIVVFVLSEATILITTAYLGIVTNSKNPMSVFFMFLIIWSISRLLIIPVFAMLAINLHYVYEESQRLAQGVMGDDLSSKLTVAGIRSYGKNLDKIKREINKAMEQELKSEKLKSELITNVSHDLKTPLTSITSYVDILKNGNLTDEERDRYLGILSKHTDKLSLLLNDLIEASQISSGNIEINLEKTSLNIVIAQTIEEFADKLEQSELLPRIEIPEKDIYILGDGKWLWRILSNLLSNACKYSVPDTDIAVRLSAAKKMAIVEISNLSKNSLSVEGEELFERFVRGDESRHTEGNGLGLSIAKSLTEMQGGKMDITVNEGVFTVTLEFEITK